MFRSFIYLDEEKLYTYKRQIDGVNSAKPTAMTKKKTTGFVAQAKNLGINGTTETNISGEFEKDISFDYDRFEISLEKLDGEDYYDVATNPDYDLTTVPSMKIVRICDGFEIPEEFDMINLAERFKPMIMKQIETESVSEQEALENFFGTAEADIPIVIYNDDITVAGKLHTKHLREEYATLDDYADQEVFLLCKVVGVARKDNVEIFDPLKDFVKLPRNIRRQMDTDSNTTGIDKITIKGPVLKVEIIAIYK